jgi:hypothetical protein
MLIGVFSMKEPDPGGSRAGIKKEPQRHKDSTRFTKKKYCIFFLNGIQKFVEKG